MYTLGPPPLLVLCAGATVLVGVFVGGDVLLCADRYDVAAGVGADAGDRLPSRSRVVGLPAGCAFAVAGVTALGAGLGLVDRLEKALVGEPSIDAMAGSVERLLTCHAAEIRAGDSALLGTRLGAVDVVSAVVLVGPRSRDLAICSLTLPATGPVEQQVITSRGARRVFAPPPVRLDIEMCAMRGSAARSVGEALDRVGEGFRYAAGVLPARVSAEWDHLLVTREGVGPVVAHT